MSMGLVKILVGSFTISLREPLTLNLKTYEFFKNI